MILAAENFRDEEYSIPRKYWESQGADVITASTDSFSRGVLGTEVNNDFLLDEVSEDLFDGIFFVGGAGCMDLEENEDAKTLAEEFVKAGKVSGAICAAPRLFLAWGILKGKKCTGWNGDNEFSKLAEKAKAIFTGESCTRDGKIVTADGPDSAAECAEEYWSVL